MRRRLIQTVLPLLFCLFPLAAAVVIAAAIEPIARAFYLRHITAMDTVILSLGSTLFVLQMIWTFRALRWVGPGFDERGDAWLSSLAQAAEWFPLLGLLGTVAAILQTFSSMSDTVTPREIITRYAPAITATGSGLFMALINILPTWLVTAGRELIRKLGGEAPREPGRPLSPSGERSAPRPDSVSHSILTAEVGQR